MAWLLGARVLGLRPSGLSTAVYERSVLAAARVLERDRDPPFGQSLVAIGHVAG